MSSLRVCIFFKQALLEICALRSQVTYSVVFEVSMASGLIKEAVQRLSNREQELCLSLLCSPYAFQAELECPQGPETASGQWQSMSHTLRFANYLLMSAQVTISQPRRLMIVKYSE